MQVRPPNVRLRGSRLRQLRAGASYGSRLRPPTCPVGPLLAREGIAAGKGQAQRAKERTCLLHGQGRRLEGGYLHGPHSAWGAREKNWGTVRILKEPSLIRAQPCRAEGRRGLRAGAQHWLGGAPALPSRSSQRAAALLKQGLQPARPSSSPPGPSPCSLNVSSPPLACLLPSPEQPPERRPAHAISHAPPRHAAQPLRVRRLGRLAPAGLLAPRLGSALRRWLWRCFSPLRLADALILALRESAVLCGSRLAGQSRFCSKFPPLWRAFRHWRPSRSSPLHRTARPERGITARLPARTTTQCVEAGPSTASRSQHRAPQPRRPTTHLRRPE